MGCFFLLIRFNNSLPDIFPAIYSGRSSIKERAAYEASGLSSYGWYTKIKDVAEKGVFTFGNNSPIKSVEKTNLYDFLLYISANASEAFYQKKLQEHDS